ncbi:hypothetical protein [Microcystis phage Mwe-JY25]
MIAGDIIPLAILLLIVCVVLAAGLQGTRKRKDDA